MPNWILLLNFSTCKERFNTSLLLHFLKYIFVSKVSTPLFYILCTGDPIFLGVSNLIRQQTTPSIQGKLTQNFSIKCFFSQKALDSLPLFLSLLAIGDLIHVRCNLTTSLIQVFFFFLGVQSNIHGVITINLNDYKNSLLIFSLFLFQIVGFMNQAGIVTIRGIVLSSQHCSLIMDFPHLQYIYLQCRSRHI